MGNEDYPGGHDPPPDKPLPRRSKGGVFVAPEADAGSDQQNDYVMDVRRFVLVLIVLAALVAFAGIAIYDLRTSGNHDWALPAFTTIVGSFVGFVGGTYAGRARSGGGDKG